MQLKTIVFILLTIIVCNVSTTSLINIAVVVGEYLKFERTRLTTHNISLIRFKLKRNNNMYVFRITVIINLVINKVL